MKVFVKNTTGEPLMPTTPRKARKLLKSGEAEIAARHPFTIRLLHEVSPIQPHIQPITLGIDAGYLEIGYSAVTPHAELVGGEVTMLRGMSQRITDKAMYRRNRRGRLRYRKMRYDKSSATEGWFAPSIVRKVDAHIKVIERMKAAMPIGNVVIEVANFDIQKLKDEGIEGVGYQQGEQFEWSENLRSYIIHRDHHKCKNPDCKNRTKEKILCVHHLGYWYGNDSNRPDNLITLCDKCHTSKNHDKKTGFLWGWKPKIANYRPETFMTQVRWKLVNDTEANHTYGHLTKEGRRVLNLEKTHHNDAFVVAGGTDQLRAEPFDMEEIKRNNRSLATFVDAQYMDTRTGEILPGKVLFSGRANRNKNLSGENLRKYRGHKTRKGQVRRRKVRYPLQAGDLIMVDGVKYRCGGNSNEGRYVIIRPEGKVVRVKPENVIVLRRRKGMVATI